jgi:hypothetical protein
VDKKELLQKQNEYMAELLDSLKSLKTRKDSEYASGLDLFRTLRKMSEQCGLPVHSLIHVLLSKHMVSIMNTLSDYVGCREEKSLDIGDLEERVLDIIRYLQLLCCWVVFEEI